ncbi:MAG: polyribonucleotide nucleotidyltransferase [Proteobacteria bacterium]|nr:polyribonucleotide nucleotidyltransferase [Pseudomonadota bacterium]
MYKLVEKSVEIGGKTITFETGKLAKQANGAVVVKCEESHVLVTAVCEGVHQARFDFVPLTVNYEDRNGADGTIPGGYLKREGGRTDREILICRLIDRPIRPMFPKHFRNELQIIATVMSYDINHETDVLALCGASAAVYISNAPMSEPIAGVRVVHVGEEFILNPTYEQRNNADLNLVIAGTATAITMVEGGCKEATEEVVLDALELAQEAIAKIVACISELQSEVGVPTIEYPPAPQIDESAMAYMEEHGPAPMAEALKVPTKHERKVALKAARNALVEKFVADKDEEEAAQLGHEAKEAWGKLFRKTMRFTVLRDNKRIDGRLPDEVRPIWCELTVSPRAHGSAVFTRGETQGYVTIAMGTDEDAQRLELPGRGRTERRFMLTYKFPPFCTGEARRLGGPRRREVGHGALARRAILPVLPLDTEFPYVLRSTSEILESNGSSSMATVCGTTLALMDAGVPIKAPVAGIAMGLIKEGDEFAVLSDILGDEDHLGDMDFKITGTREGITAFQMDVKIAGVNREIMEKALAQAKAGRLHILDAMSASIEAPREDFSKYAPRITTLHIKADKIRDLIGPGGKVIRSLQDTCGVRIKVDDSGRVDVASSNEEDTDRAVAMIREITQEAELGALYVGVVKRVVDFGAFVEIFPGTDGLIHISHLAKERVRKVTDVVNEGDEVLVRVIDVDRSGKIRLSRKEALDANA